MNEARKRRDQLQTRIRAYREVIECTPPPPVKPTSEVRLHIYNAAQDVIASGKMPAENIVEKLNEIRERGLWVKQGWSAVFIVPSAIHRICVYPEDDFCEEEPFPELKRPPSKDSFKDPNGGFVGGLFGGLTFLD